MGGYAKKIEDTIKQLPYNRLIVSSELYKNNLSDIPELTYYKTLERLSKKGILKHLTKGIYYRPKSTELGTDTIGDEEIAEYYIGDSRGVIVGDRLYNRIGITHHIGKKIEILSNKLNEEKKNIRNVEVKKVSLELNKDTVQIIKILDILQNYHKIENLNNKALMRYLSYFLKFYSDDSASYVIENRKYKKSTIAFLAKLLDELGVEHSLNKYLSPLSNYKLPILEREGKEMPDSVANILNNFSEKVKKLFDDKLSKIVLYGSYARGDYRENSDVDIMILVKISDEEEIRKYRNEVCDMVFDIEMETGTDISPIIKNEEHFEYWVETLPFYRNIKDEGVVISG